MKRLLIMMTLCLAMMLALVSCGGCDSCGGGDSTTLPGTNPPEPTPVDGFIALTDNGKSLFRIVIPVEWRTGMVKDTATVFKNRIYEATGAPAVLAYDNSAIGKREILIGQTTREESVEACSKLAPRDWSIKVTENRIIVAGGSMYSTCLALDELMRNLVLYEDNLYIDPAYEAEYIYERDNTEDVYGTLDEKLAQFGNPNGRLMVTSHRAENVNNPENSLSAIAAAVALGADILELDVTKTKDGHYVLMHDTTLTRTTNVADFAGKNGYPTSHNVSDWTLEQIRTLTLNGSQFNETVPTLEEALMLVRGRAIFDFDKTTNAADRLAVYRIAVRLRAVDSVMYQGGDLSHDVMKTIYEETGIALPYLKGAGTVDQAISYLKNTYKEVEYARQAIQLTTSLPTKAKMDQITGTCRVWMNTLGWATDPTGAAVQADNVNSWNTLWDLGVSVIQTDQPYECLAQSLSRENGSGVTWSLVYSHEPVYDHAKAYALFKLARQGELYYTLDGSDPTPESEKVTGKLSFDGDCLVKLLFVPADGSENIAFSFNVMLGSEEFYALYHTAGAP